ncbi:MAG TPA: carboxypeptidase regulatory-like domain-containing protein [Pyrinomonadaceae bacterium]
MRTRSLTLFHSLLAFGLALGFPLQSGASATSRSVSPAATDARVDSARRTANFANAPVAAVAADPNATVIYSQPYDGQSGESSSKIQGGTQYDREAADDFDLNATITRVLVRGVRGGYNMPPNPVYYGVYVRFYDGTGGTPGALQVEHYLPAGTPGVVFDAAQPNTFDITLPAAFNATGKHFLSVQPVFGGQDTWGVSSSNYQNVRGSALVKRDRLANEAWAVSGIAGRLYDMSFDLFGTLLSAPRIDALSPNPVTRSGLVRITGAYFGARGDGQLTIDGKQSPHIVQWADNQIIAYVPETSALGDVPVSITSAGRSGAATLNVTTRPTEGHIRWRFTVAAGHVPRRPAIGPDGTVYVNDVLGRLYALAPDGALKWVFQAGLVGARGSVSVGADGTVYVGGLVPKNPATPCQSNTIVNVEGIFALNPDGTQKWLFDKTCDGLLSGPDVGPDGNIHAVTESIGIGAFALKPDGTLAHAPTGRFGVDGDTGTEIVFGPAAPGQAPTQKYFQYESGGLYGFTLQGQQVFLHPLNAVGITQPVAGQRTGTVYTSTDQQTAGRFFAVSPQGALRWVSPIRPTHSFSIPDTPPSESAVYVRQDGAKLHRLNPEDGSIVWTFVDNNESLFDPIASPDDRLVLMGGQANYNQPGFFEAVSSDGRQLWKQHLPDEPGLTPYGQVVPKYRARFTADGQTAYIAAHVSGADYSATIPAYSFFYALDTSDNNAPINQPPKATITSPVYNTDSPVNTEINITAKVEDDGQIARVDFYYIHNGIRTDIGSDTTPDADGTYRAKFTPTRTGGHGIVAAAYDVGGLRGDSQSALVWVTDRRPTVSWVNPTDGASFAAPASITLTARAADPDGKIVGVEFKTYQTGVVGYNVLGSDTTPDANGNYQIEWANPPQGAYELTATATDNSGLSLGTAITIIVGAASTPVYTIGGTVRDPGGQPMSGVLVTLGGSLSATATTDANGTYLFSDLRGGNNYSVTPSRAGYSFTPTQHVYNNLGANQTADFNGARDSYTVRGQIKDNNNVGLTEVALNVTGGPTPTTFYTSTDGNYSFSLPAGGSYTITPTLVNYTFAPASQSFANLSADQTANFTGTRNTHGISGRVIENTGYTLRGVTVTLSGSQTGTATTDPSGYFSFNLPAGGTYTVTPSLSGYTFSPASLTYSNLTGNVSGSFTATSTNQLPRATLTSPANNATFVAPATLTINADASDADGTVSKVEFYAEYRSGAFHFQTIHLGTDTTAPYSATFTYSGADTFALRAIATDDRGGRSIAESHFVTFTLNAPNQTPNWQKQFSSRRPDMNGAPYEVMGFSAVDKQHVWASHINAKVSRTTDGGLTWNTVNVQIGGGNNNHAQDVDFVDTQTGWVVGGEDNAVLRSTDGGRTFVRQPTGRTTELFGVDALDANTVLAVGFIYASVDGSGAIVLRSRDGGATWAEVTTPFRHHTRAAFYAVHFINQTTGWVAGSSGNVIKTTNGGSTWTDVSVPTELPLSDVSFADANNGWVVGYGGVIFRTTDGGATWQQINAGTSEAVLSVNAVSPTVAWIACYGSPGFVARTTDGGVTWHREYPEVVGAGNTSDSPGSYSVVLFSDADNGWAAGYSGINRRSAAQTGTATYSISGRVTNAQGLGVQGVTITLSGSRSAATTTDVDGGYTFNEAAGGNYTVTPTLANYTFASPSLSFTNLTSNQAANFTGAPDTFRVGGRIADGGNSALAGVTVTLTGSQTGTATTDASGNYSFDLPRGGSYTVTPSLANYTFNPTSLSFNSLGANQTANFGASRHTFTVGGQVRDHNNAALAGVAVTLTGTQTGTATTDAGGNYTFTLFAGGNYTVTPSRVNYTFAPPSQSFNNLSGNQTANFNATHGTYTIGGLIRDGNNAPMPGATVTLSGSRSDTMVADLNGVYYFEGLPAGGNYIVTPSRSFFSFNPASATFNNLGGNQTANFTGTPNTVTISVRVRDASGNAIDGVHLSVSGERNVGYNVDANGQFVLRDILSGGIYTLTPSKEGFTFNPSQLVFTNPATDQFAEFVAVPNTASVQFGAATFTESEGRGAITLNVTRTGNMDGTLSVAYRTTDNPAAVRCDDNATMPGMAFARCDYATSVDRISFAPGESSATLTIPLVDDSHAENNEWVEVVLLEPTGAKLGGQTNARFTITDNDAPNAGNALDSNEFFVRMQYLDFLNREPDAEGKAAWLRVLDNCLPGDPACDRNTVSSSFFRSKEFQLKGLFAYLFYKVALNRLPQYAEITPDMRSVSGQSEDEVYRKRAEFAAGFVGRAAFREQYDALSDQAFVNTLLNRYNLTTITTRDPANPDTTGRVTLTSSQLLNQLSAGSLSRAQVLRAIVESDEVAAVEYNGAFVAMQYFGYLRRDPDADGYNNWLRVLDANPGDYRTMVHGFESSVEYRLRFGQP